MHSESSTHTRNQLAFAPLRGSLDRSRRRHATAASSVDFFCVPFGGAPTGASLHLRLPLQRRRPRRRALRLRRLRPALPASSPMCAPETCNWASDADCDYGGPGSGSARPGPTACGTGPSSYVVTKVTQLCHDAHDRDPSPYLRTAVPNSKSN